MIYPDGGASFLGVARCASVWECPNCAERISFQRGEECNQILQAHLKGGGGAYLLTLTVPHDAGDSLERLRRSVSGAWSFICSGAPWLRLKARCRIIGNVRALECTFGPHGWHPHLHVVLFTESWLSDEKADALRLWVARRWSARMNKDGWRTPDGSHGVTLQRGDRAGYYIAKLGLSREVTSPLSKEARVSNRTPWQVLEDLALQKMSKRAYNPGDLAIWHEWCREMVGARQLTWSKGLRERYLDGPDRSDQELAEEEVKDPVEVLVLSESDWWAVVNIEGLSDRLLDKAEELAAQGPLDDRARTALRLMVENAIGRKIGLRGG